MKYYLHDANAFEDEKITELYIKFGYEGLGLFYTILEKLAKQEKPVKTHVLKSQLNVGKRLEKCWLFMEEIDLISSNNGETFNKQLLNFSEKYKIKSEKNRKRISEWRNNQTVSENVTCYNDVRNASKVNRSKVNRIEEDSIYIYSPFYDSEIKDLEKSFENGFLKTDYLNFIKFIYGENELNAPLTDILSIPEQLKFSDFIRLKQIADNKNNSLREILLRMDNDKKYTSGKKSLYTTLLKWVSTKFEKSKEPDSIADYNKRVVEELRLKRV